MEKPDEALVILNRLEPMLSTILEQQERILSEQGRMSAELVCMNQELVRLSAEQGRTNQELTRLGQEQVRMSDTLIRLEARMTSGRIACGGSRSTWTWRSCVAGSRRSAAGFPPASPTCRLPPARIRGNKGGIIGPKHGTMRA